MNLQSNVLELQQYYDYAAAMVDSVVIDFQLTGANQLTLNKQIYFNNNNKLNDATITAIHCYTNTELADVLTPSGSVKDLPTYAGLAGGYIVLVNFNNTVLFTCPLTLLTLPQNNGRLTLLNISNVNIAASYVKFTSNPGALNANNALYFNIYYNYEQYS